MIMDYIIENHSLVEYKGSAEIITIQDVATIDSFAFKGNSTLKSITISSDIRIIKDRAFECCYALEELIINSQDLVIEEYAFNNCPKLRTVRIAKGISEIPRYCFFACSSLKELSLPESIIRIGDGAFETCGIETVVIPNGVEEIGDNAFGRCWKLKKVELPSSIKTIGRGAFSYCKYLPTDTLEIPAETKVAASAFTGCCKKGYRTVKCEIGCEDNDHDIHEELTLELRDDDTVEDVVVDEVIDIFREEYEDIIEKAMDSPIVLEVDGRYNLHNISDRLYPGAKAYIAQSVAGIMVRVKEFESEKVVYDCSIPLAVIIDKIIEERMGCESWDCDLGGIIENSLLRFEKEGSWHFGLIADSQILSDARFWPSPSKISGELNWKIGEAIYKPTIWFGNSDTPIAPWVIYKGMPLDTQAFWKETDEYYIMQALIEDCNDTFLMWYFPECGRCAPDMEEIKHRCPVDLNIEIESDIFWNNFNEFFLHKYKEAQSKSIS